MYPRCENCEIEIRWRPTVVDDHMFCCLGCAEGGPCTCDYSALSGAKPEPVPPVRVIRFEIDFGSF